MKLVGARARVRRHNTRDGFAELSIVILRRNLRFFDSIETRIHDDDPENRVLVVGSIQFITSAAEVLPVHEDLLATLRIFRGSVAPPGENLGSWGEQLQTLEVPVVDGQFLQLFPGEFHRDDDQ